MKNLILLLIIVPSFLFSQGWEKTYGPGHGYSVKETSDGGFILTGMNLYWQMFLIKTDNKGNIEWARTYGDNYQWSTSVIETEEGGYVLTGTTGTSPYLMKVDENGEKIWSKIYDFPSYTTQSIVQKTADGGFVLFGTSESRACIIKTDLNGNVEWMKKYGGQYATSCGDGQQTADLGYILFGDIETSSYYQHGVLLLKTDVNGDSLWSKVYFDGWSSGYSGQQTTDGGYIITGPDSLSSNILLIRTDEKGDTIWTKIYSDNNADIGYAVRQTSDGGFILTGGLNSFGHLGYLFLIKTDDSGEILWNKRYTGKDRNLGYFVQETSDHGFIVTGETEFPSGIPNIFLIKTDSEGNILFTQNIPIPNPNRKLVKTVDLSGREISKPQKNQPYIEIYDDGTTQKKIKIK